MGHASDPGTLVLLALRLKAFGPAGDLAGVHGMELGVVQAELDALLADEHVLHHDGAVVGWALTAKGKVEGEQRLAAELEEVADARESVEHLYEALLRLNPTLLRACSDWQIRVVDGVERLNDHTDRDHDAAVLADLGRLTAELGDQLTDTVRILERFGRYRPAFDDALRRAEAGEVDWVTKPIMPSYHTTWFELHEDLLATLGIDRVAEAERREAGLAATSATDDDATGDTDG